MSSNSSANKIIYQDVEAIDLESAYSFEGDYLPHILINGISGSGKSTLIVNLILKYIVRGYTVIFREMGKFDFVSRFQCVQDIIDWVNSDFYTNDDREQMLDFWETYEEKFGNLVVVINSPHEIEEHKVNLLVWDILKETKNKGVLIDQYYNFFLQLRELRETDWESMNIVVFLDEANHIMPTINKNPYKQLISKIIDMTWWLAQWRGYRVRFIMSTHSTSQLNNDARLHCGLFFWKKSRRQDSKLIVQHELFHIDDEEFVEVYKRIQALQPNETLFIDDRNNFKFLEVSWIPKQYSLQDMLDFIYSFNPKPIVAPVNRSWEGVTKIAKHLVTNLNEELEKKLFYQEYDDKTEIIKLRVKIHHFYEYLFSFDEYKGLFGDHELIKEYLINAFLVQYENNYEGEIRSSFINIDELLADLSFQVESKKLPLFDALILAWDYDKNISNKKISEYFPIAERGKGNSAPFFKVQFNKLKFAHTHLDNIEKISLLDYYHSLTEIERARELTVSNTPKQKRGRKKKNN